MNSHGKKHDIWRGSLIETFDVTTPYEPVKPPRSFAGTVDVRHDRNMSLHRSNLSKKAQKKKNSRQHAAEEKALREKQLEIKTENTRADYLKSHGENNMRVLLERLESLRKNEIVFHDVLGFGEVLFVQDGIIHIDFIGNEERFCFPLAFYNETLVFVDDTPALRSFFGFSKEPSGSAFDKKREKVPPKQIERTYHKPPDSINSTVQDLCVGSLVEHEIYGIGTVVIFNPPKINVHFRRKETLTFKYPEDFERGVLHVAGRNKAGRAVSTKTKVPSKGPKLRVKNGNLVCPNCGFIAKPGESVHRCPRCARI